jgi:pimeloyl-ACP methyl ester carboxylesterase
MIEPFQVEVPATAIADLRDRLSRTRWPDQLPDAGWDYGTEEGFLQSLCAYWHEGYDLEGFAGRCNAFPQFRATIDGQPIHFIHARSPEPAARPLLLTHGWPGSVVEFLDVLGPLSDPVAHGGRAEDAFHVVAPSLPGYGFSGPTTERGWSTRRVAKAFVSLMAELGYDRYYAQGGDWGSAITMNVADEAPDHVAAAHVNLLFSPRPKEPDGELLVTPQEAAGLAAVARFQAEETGYQAIQSTKPQTLAYGLTDSPAGLAGWITEKFRTWTWRGESGQPDLGVSRDRLLDNISVYWFTGTINSSMRLYYESLGPGRFATMGRPTVPLGHAVYPGEIYRLPRSWAEAAFNIVHWVEMPRGGHFAAMEVPDLYVDDVRACFAKTPL